MNLELSDIYSIITSTVTLIIIVFYDCRLKHQQSIINKNIIERERQQELEKKKANLLIMKYDEKIRIQNIGKCKAINLRACLQAENLMFSDADKLLGMTLEEGEYVDINTVFASQIPSDGNLKIQVQWDDDFKKDNIKDKTIF